LQNFPLAAFLSLLAQALPIVAGAIDPLAHPRVAALIAVLLKFTQAFASGAAQTTFGATASGHSIEVSHLPADHSHESLLNWAATHPTVGPNP